MKHILITLITISFSFPLFSQSKYFQQGVEAFDKAVELGVEIDSELFERCK